MAESKGLQGLQIARVSPGELVLDPENTRVHSDENLRAIRASLLQFGQVSPLVVHRESRRVVGGNGTLQAIRELGWKSVAVVEYDGSLVEAKALAIALNATTDKSRFDRAKLAEAIASLQELEFPLESTGFSEAELAKITASLADLPLDMLPGEDGEAGSDEYAPASHVRMVQLFLDDRTIETFTRLTQELAIVYGLDNLTDTVLRAVQEAHGAKCPSPAEPAPSPGGRKPRR